MTPIALFAYNRPRHLLETLEALSRADGFVPEMLTIFCDGGEGVEPTREVARNWVHEVGGHLVERPHNMGYRNLTEGVSEICARFGQTVVLEDDHIVSPDFLTFMSEGLERYRDDESVWLINGYMYPGAQPDNPSTFFLPSAFPWGWATWERAWRHFTWSPPNWQRLRSRWHRRKFDFNGQWRISRWLIDVMEGRLDAWDPQWAYQVFQSGALGLFPSRPLVWNTGLASGVHGDILAPDLEELGKTFFGSQKQEDFLQPQLPSDWSFPSKIKTDRRAYRRMATFFRKERKGLL